jgi:ankyrin repeat protein
VKELHRRGASVEAIDQQGNTLLHETAAAAMPRTPRPKELLRGLDALAKLGLFHRLASRTNFLGQSPLHLAAAAAPDQKDIDDVAATLFFDMLLSQEPGFDINLQDRNGETALHLAAALSEARLWKLIEAGGDITAASSTGRIPLHYAAEKGTANCVALLCEEHQKKGLDINVQDIKGEAPLHIAAHRGDEAVVRLLLDAGGDIFLYDHERLQPYEIARSHSANNFHPKTIPEIVDQIMFGTMENDGRREPGKLATPLLEHVVRELQGRDYVTAMRTFTKYHPSTSEYKPGDLHDIRRAPESEAPISAVDAERGQVSRLHLTREFLTSLLSRNKSQSLALLQNGADIVSPIFEGHESLVHAIVRAGATFDLMQVMPFLADINAIHPPLLHTALQRKEFNIPVMEYLIGSGVNIDRKYQDTRQSSVVRFPWYEGAHTALHALSRGHHWWHAQAISLLVRLGGDLNMEDEKGYSCLRLSNPEERALNKPGPYASLCRKAIVDIQPAPEQRSPVNTTDFIPAIAVFDLAAVEAMLATGADPNGTYVFDESPVLPLVAAAMAWETAYLEQEGPDDPNACPAIMTALLRAGADPCAATGGGRPVFHAVCALNAPVGPFIAAGAPLEARDAAGATPLIEAAGWFGYMPQGGRDIFALELIEAGANVHAQDNEGRTPLHAAVMCESHLTNPQVIGALLGAGADAGAKDGSGKDAFYYFLRTDGVDMEHYRNDTLVELFEGGGDACAFDEETGESNLHVLARQIGEEKVEADDPSDDTLERLYESMAAKGADRNAEDHNGATPIFHFIEATGARDLPDSLGEDWYRQFISCHDVTAVCSSGDTLLHVLARSYSAAGGDQDAMLFRLLMDLGVDPARENTEGMSALDIAIAQDSTPLLVVFKASQEQVPT